MVVALGIYSQRQIVSIVPISQETLWRRVWIDKYDGQGNVMDVSVHRLRSKLESGSPFQRIITVRGRGYMLLKNPITPSSCETKPENQSH